MLVGDYQTFIVKGAICKMCEKGEFVQFQVSMNIFKQK